MDRDDRPLDVLWEDGKRACSTLELKIRGLGIDKNRFRSRRTKQ
jgi:hypothetical protein